MRKLRMDEVKFSVEVEFDDIPVRGNALASGDDAADKECEDEILARLERDDVWAWCWVEVTAHWGDHEGKDSLGGISVRNEAEFNEVFLPNMKANALEFLNEALREYRSEAKRVREILR